MKAAAVLVYLLASVAGAASAQEPAAPLVAFRDGTVTIRADHAPVTELLGEWARNGRTEILGAETLAGRRLSLTLINVAEAEAMRAILGPAWGFVGSLRVADAPTLSRFSRLVVRPAQAAASTAADTTLPPEARFSYSTPGKSRVIETAGAPVDRTTPPDAAVPEAIFEFFQPGKAAAADQRPHYPTPGPPPPAPETLFQYYQDPSQRTRSAEFVLPATSAAPALVPLPPGQEPEARFQHFVPAKARASTKPGS